MKQAETLKQLVEKGGKIPLGLAMRNAGYSPATAKTPQKLTDSKGWQELLAYYADDDTVLARIKKALASDDNRAALQAADMLLKLKDKYPAGKLKINEYNDELDKLREAG